MKTRRHQQSGFFLIEALVAILIFSIGILGMVALSGTAMGAQTDARYRTDAAALADDLAGVIVMNVARNSNAAFLASLQQFQHRPAGTDCAFSGADSTEPNEVAWLARVGNQGVGLPGLPNAASANQQVLIDTTPTGYNRVQITVCWQAPNDRAMRRHTLVTYVNGLSP